MNDTMLLNTEKNKREEREEREQTKAK